ncbi:hypothetical protein AALO_G00038100 [Alosa alosa]|uniref:Uncharacterized protein n=1 Tax=Alosa alosa TaxID=278164 RepID=A0AAV6HAT8_9TELE|nr:hypothetical protein AALO_G00038100 [Alosa alosa]
MAYSDTDIILSFSLISASIYVVRKIRASIQDGEQREEPIFTPCSLAKGEHKQLSVSGKTAMLTSDPDDVSAAGAQAPSTETAVQKCGS